MLYCFNTKKLMNMLRSSELSRLILHYLNQPNVEGHMSKNCQDKASREVLTFYVEDVKRVCRLWIKTNEA